MSASSAINAILGKPGPAKAGANFPHFGETNFRVISAIKEMYAESSVVFGRWLSVSDKTAKRKLNFERGLSVEELGILIRSERGFEVLAAVMGNAQPAWWRLMVPLMDAANARQMQIAARRRLKKTIESALDADEHLTRTIQLAEALSDQDHAGPQLDALRSFSRVPDRAVAKTKR